MQSFKSHLSSPFNSSCVIILLYNCQKFTSLLLLRPHSWACLTFMGDWLLGCMVFKWFQLVIAWPSRHVATVNKELPQDWLVRLGIDVAVLCDMWTITASVKGNYFLKWNPHFMAANCPPPTIFIEMLVVVTSW